MRNIFIVAAKLLGLLQLFGAIAAFLQVAFTIPFYGGEQATQMQLILIIVGSVLFLVVNLALALILVFKTEWLANLLRIPADVNLAPLQKPQVLNLGAKLIGLYILLQGLPSFVRALFQIGSMQPFGAFMFSTISTPVVQIGLGLFLVLKTTKVVGLITQNKTASE